MDYANQVLVLRRKTTANLREFRTQAKRCACRKPRPCRLSSMVTLVDDSTETVLSIYGEASDLVGFKSLRPRSQGCLGGE